MGEVSTVRKKKRLIKTICFGFVLLASSTFFIALAAYKDGVAEYWKGDYEKALSKLSQEAEDGDAKAHRYLGHLYYNGKGVTKDLNADPALLTLNLAYFNIKYSQVEEYLINEQTKVAVLSS